MLNKTAQLTQIIADIQDVWSGSPWHGRSTKELLSDVKHDSGPIRRLIIHMIAWRVYILQKIEGSPTEIEMDSPEDWPEDSDTPWFELMESLQQNIDQIIEILGTKEDSWLDEPVPGVNYDYRFLIGGLNQHDIYHTGQIVILNKMVT